MGYVVGLTSAFCFAASTILVRVGQRHRTGDDGVLMTVFVNVVFLGATVLLFAEAPPFDAAGVGAIMVGGIIGTVFGRSANLRAVRLIGPSRTAAFMTGAPVAAAIVGWFVLGEALSAIEMLGGGLVVGGLLWLVRVRAPASGRATGEKVPLRHYLVAAVAPLFFGTAFVFRKWGLERFDSAILGAFLGVVAAFVVLVLIDVVRGAIADRVALNVTSIPWWFVAAGVATSLALLTQFATYSFLPAWVVGILQATQGIWAMLLSIAFLKGDERIDAALVGSVALVVAGVVLIAAF